MCHLLIPNITYKAFLSSWDYICITFRMSACKICICVAYFKVALYWPKYSFSSSPILTPLSLALFPWCFGGGTTLIECDYQDVPISSPLYWMNDQSFLPRFVDSMTKVSYYQWIAVMAPLTTRNKHCKIQPLRQASINLMRPTRKVKDLTTYKMLKPLAFFRLTILSTGDVFTL